jgi:ribose transport system ATP-binding protein
VNVEDSDKAPTSPPRVSVSIRNVSKRFGSTQALSNVSMEITGGEVLGFLGANGAGKSTMIKILAGIYDLDSGSIQGPSGEDFHELNFSFIHQDLGLVAWMTVAESIALGATYPRKRGLISWKSVRSQALEALADIAPHIDVNSEVGLLSRADQSLVAIARALHLHSDVLVLDEPTASLHSDDCDHLIQVVRKLASQGVAVLYVSHRLDEVFKVADQVLVLRDGEVVSAGPVNGYTPELLVEEIVGKSTAAHVRHRGQRNEPVIQVSNAVAPNLLNVSFELGQGEVLALVGLNGAGQREMGRILSGDLPTDSGTFLMKGKPLPSSVHQCVSSGIALLTSSRAEEGLALDMNVRENISPNLRAQGSKQWKLLSPRKEKVQARNVMSKYKVKPSTTENPVATLSGGNQQKVIIGRWLDSPARVIILEEPTAGVDFGSKQDIYAAMDGAVKEGRSLLLVSSDFEEVALVADRALVFSEGRIVAELEGQDLSVNTLVAYASGALAVVGS